MPDAYRLFELTRLRESQGLTLAEMARCCGLTGKRGRETAGRWERGQSVPRHSRRRPFLRYLCQDLRLKQDYEQFCQVFDILCEEWDWEPLSDLERQRLFSGPDQPALIGQDQDKLLPQIDARFSRQPDEHLFGIAENAARLLSLLIDQGQRIISIEGLGGIGKTTLAEYVVRQWLSRGDAPQGVVWVSAKQEFLGDRGIRNLIGVTTQINLDDLFNQLLHKLGVPVPYLLGLDQKVSRVAERVRTGAYLIVLDNLESVQDFESLAPLLEQIPSRFIITSREHLPSLTAVTSFRLDELSRTDSLSLIRYVAQRKAVRGIPAGKVYDLTGGNPLAIYLAVSLMRLMPPEQVLGNLRLGSTEAIYRYIYWKAWERLPDPSKQLLFAIQRVGDMTTWDWLRQNSDFSAFELEQALQALSDFSLIQTITIDEQRSFSIHRLTSTFLCTEVLGWK